MVEQTITIHDADGTWVVRARGAVIAESNAALELVEGDYPPVIYFPREDVAMPFLDPSETTSTCPHKGKATYFSLVAKSGVIQDAAWSYESPHDGVSRIAGHIAFYPSKATVEQL
ncbi:MAG: DUF427 domain-containing protein [Pseudomonadota bacterium]